MRNTARDPLLDLLRLAGAIFVVLGHAKALFLAPAWQMPLTLIGKGFYFLHALGHPSVIVFFVLSGYLVGGVTSKKVRTGRFASHDYWIARISRLWTVLLPCLVIGIILDLVTLRFFSGAYQLTNFHEIGLFSSSVHETLNLKNAAGTAVFLNSVVTAAPGSSVQMWSLSYEWWYYALAGLGAMAISQSGKKRWQASLALVAVLAFIAVFNWKILAYMAIWLLGTAAYSTAVPTRYAPWLTAGSCLLGLVTVVINALGLAPQFLGDTMLALSVAVFLAARKTTWEAKEQFVRPDDLLARLADSSFTLYACHMPMLLLLACILSPSGRITSLTPQALAPLYLSVLIVLAAAVGIASVTEWRTPLIRSWMMSLVRKKAEAAA